MQLDSRRGEPKQQIESKCDNNNNLVELLADQNVIEEEKNRHV